MDRLPLVLLLCADNLTRLVVESGLQIYGYDVVLASTPEDAAALLRSRRVGVLVADVDPDVPSRLAFVRAARKADPALTVIYTARVPSRLPDREKVAGAPCLRTPYHPHQLVSLIGQLRRPGTDQDESQVA
ncbi:MAG TPA: response regulator [Microvirga sp.]|nr:response regulator [Microvirga sp.]